MKLFYFDTETGGVDTNVCGLIELGYIIEIDKEVKEEGCLKMNPIPLGKELHSQALEVNKLTEQEIQMYPSPLEFYNNLIQVLDKYIDRYNKLDKFICCGYNVRFDIDMLKQFFIDMGDQYYGSWFDNRPLDIFALIPYLIYKEKFPELNSYKLENVAYVLGIESDTFHSALDDVRITREVFNKLIEIDSFTN